MEKYYSNGKLLLTGEYVVLDGALALALPTAYGQSLEVNSNQEKVIFWKSFDQDEKSWLEAIFEHNGDNLILEEKVTGEKEEIETLLKILNAAAQLNPDRLTDGGVEVVTKMDFPLKWGLGSSSCLINNVASWFNVNAYDLLEKTFGGSGYDIAAAQNDRPVTYQLNGENRSVLIADFNPPFKDQLFFVYLNRKQNSRDSILHYKEHAKLQNNQAIERVSALTTGFMQCKTLEEFKILVEIHETVISKLIDKPKIKTSLFPDFGGTIKSLGGWGGDFILATGRETEKNYFREKGFETVIPYTEMVK